ncbi:hypothetical protein [Metabacillus niabensis]|uniref:Uncharacterized protein n=1 Tax=Metabacillus niabensis TaxID=324854 RepID=A0ABT9YVU4_9BACI|nr:hypothetical protein [Metabacillus niabensis]MDQ0224109.1 hypothetical protein [Metabacillus niabensis]
MNHLLTCTTEELALMVSVAGFPSVAKGIAETAIGSKTENEWVAIMEATSHQLIMKRMWDPALEEKGELPLTHETLKFIEKYVNSGRMIRCSNAPQQSVLMLHHYEDDEWLMHLIDRDIIHEFALITSSQIHEIIRDYYGIEFPKFAGEHRFALTDEAFDLLSKPDEVEAVRNTYSLTENEDVAFSMFVEDLQTFNWTLFNISNFSMSMNENEMYLENILFFLPSSRGIWISEYTEDEQKPIHIHLADQQEWQEILSGIGSMVTLQV